jgi:hypothetical protein
LLCAIRDIRWYREWQPDRTFTTNLDGIYKLLLEATTTAAATEAATEATTFETAAILTAARTAAALAGALEIAVEVEVLVAVAAAATIAAPVAAATTTTTTTPGTIHLGHISFVQLKNCVHMFHLLIYFYYLYSLESYLLFFAPSLSTISMGGMAMRQVVRTKLACYL